MGLAVIGLGNPGRRYAPTRHNVGFRVVDALQERLAIPVRRRLFRSYAAGSGTHAGAPVHLVKPLTFMNASGRVLPHVLEETGTPLGEIIVVFDSLDISPGSCRMRLRGSAGGHRGLDSVIRWLGTEDFMRLAVGIGRPRDRGEVIEHVLGVPEGEEADLLEQGVLLAADAVLLLLSEGAGRVMNDVNRKENPSRDEGPALP